MEAFTECGLQNHMKSIARKCFQLQICGEILKSVFTIAWLLSRFLSGNLEVDFEDIRSAIGEFVEMLYKIANQLVEYFLARGLLMITGAMSVGMVAFVTFLYHAVVFVVKTFSLPYFLRLKDMILTLCNSDEVRCFFERVFANYGRALTMA